MRLHGIAASLLAMSWLAACATAPSIADREPDEAADYEPMLSQANAPHVVVREAFVSASTPGHNIDSPASWRGEDGRLQVAATAKSTGLLLVYDGHDGTLLRTVGGRGAGLGQLDRPNGIATLDGYAWVVERDNRRVQMFRLPAFTPLLAFGEADLRQPYGLWVRRQGAGFEVIVSDNYMSEHDEDVPPPLAELDQRFRRYVLDGAGEAWQARTAGTIGDVTPAGAIRIAESLWADEDNDRLLLAEEDVDTGTRLREYGLADGRYRGRDVGADVYQAQAEGIALMRCTDGSGVWIGSDQYKDRTLFHVFDRRDLRHLGSFAGETTANTDGIWLDEAGDARFPQGVLYAIHDDQALAAFDWRDIAAALSLPDCPRD
ncbi:phytase [Luteimonas aestuarii]|uniref:Phytase n=1 Tax=Luteimonas aestuarii TaxID=453837 RepID=A0A4R5TY64_9GAMM|nr:phytase [Luteimonas aestuarii]TDK26156.1 phytase [Luteimonas aestuarii]